MAQPSRIAYGGWQKIRLAFHYGGPAMVPPFNNIGIGIRYTFSVLLELSSADLYLLLMLKCHFA